MLPQLAVGARVVICGTASVASWDPPPTGPRVERHLLVKRARMSGFLIFDYQHRYEEAIARLAGWVRDGRLRYREDIVDGSNAAQARLPNFTGEKTSASGSSISPSLSWLASNASGCMPAIGASQTSRDARLLAAVGVKRTSADGPTYSDFLEAFSLTRQGLSAPALSQATHAD